MKFLVLPWQLWATIDHHQDLPSLMSLTIVGPVSRSHELATDFLHFLKKVKLQKIL